MARCREISRLVSESLERDLPSRERMQIRIHLVMCRRCSSFARQIRVLRTMIHVRSEMSWPVAEDPDARLSDEARERIKATLRKHST